MLEKVWGLDGMVEGNCTKRIAAGIEELYTYDARNRLTAYTKNGTTTAFEYDRAGNLLRDDKAVYTYDAFNRMVKTETFDGHVQINRYDAEGLRYEMEENGRLVQLIFNTEKEVVTEESAGEVTRLIRGRELIARSTDSTRTYYHYASDEMGSITHLADEAGAIQNQYAYDAWGNLLTKEEKIPNRYTYYGQQLDQITQQYYLRARFYNPVFGRFTQEDTYRGDGLNLYAYCANNPVRYIDPTGFYKEAHKGDSYSIIVTKDRLQHSVLGEFNSNGRLINGGHGQANIDFLNQNHIEYNIVKVYGNGVRVGNIPSHKNKAKRTGIGQSWFPESWTEKDIKNAGEYVANILENVAVPDGIWIFGEYNGVRVGIIRNNGEIGTIIPDNSRQP